MSFRLANTPLPHHNVHLKYCHDKFLLRLGYTRRAQDSQKYGLATEIMAAIKYVYIKSFFENFTIDLVLLHSKDLIRFFKTILHFVTNRYHILLVIITIYFTEVMKYDFKCFCKTLYTCMGMASDMYFQNQLSYLQLTSYLFCISYAIYSTLFSTDIYMYYILHKY